jgi:hypothetical protein
MITPLCLGAMECDTAVSQHYMQLLHRHNSALRTLLTEQGTSSEGYTLQQCRDLG